ncbi:Ribonuclease precursor [Providencia rustigianii]|uniref:Ribonuclease n=2 Tax=Providencia rustigianii TaxID=158850 RepID=D1P1W8_9GAMM|nr:MULTISPECIES: ribonuclease domain-containing protein [Providencia]EFB72589.1 ribonuclease [Providencia rustigianii DSM 4541]MTC56539.1 ribonuclease [Providencia rustigianii]MTC58798.1 ribonuclease [Providencia rustigianii]SPY78810.1 Ribonuclease precursor [Providencia rustigianii]SUC28491.1 Ribonuclease precursor [Providencia rustigianii]
MNKRVISLVLMAILIAVSLYFKGGEQPATEPAANSPSHEVAASKEMPKTIDQLTAQNNVVSFMEKYQKLPAFYITKKQAREAGWDAKKGNLCDVLPGRAIGGDRFSNREKRLPMTDSRQWYEADINYRCGHRGADRLLYSSDGMIFVTTDHYKSFQQVK